MGLQKRFSFKTRPYCVVQAGLYLTIYISHPSECWDDKGSPPSLSWTRELLRKNNKKKYTKVSLCSYGWLGQHWLWTHSDPPPFASWGTRDFWKYFFSIVFCSLWYMKVQLLAMGTAWPLIIPKCSKSETWLQSVSKKEQIHSSAKSNYRNWKFCYNKFCLMLKIVQDNHIKLPLGCVFKVHMKHKWILSLDFGLMQRHLITYM